MIRSYPLVWPAGVPRTPHNKLQTPQFKDTDFDKETKLCRDELDRLKATNVNLTTNRRIRGDGGEYSRDREPSDQGVAVWFSLKGRQLCLPNDRWGAIRYNLHAITLSIAALRGLDRWGSREFMETAFTGFTALPPPKHWRLVLGIPEGAKVDEALLSNFYRAAAKTASMQGRDLTEINLARDRARAEIGA